MLASGKLPMLPLYPTTLTEVEHHFHPFTDTDELCFPTCVLAVFLLVLFTNSMNMNYELSIALTAFLMLLAGMVAGHFGALRTSRRKLLELKSKYGSETARLNAVIGELRTELAGARTELAKTSEHNEIVHTLCEDLAATRSELEQHQEILEQEISASRAHADSLRAELASEKSQRYQIQDQLHQTKQDHLLVLESLKDQWEACRHKLEADVARLEQLTSIRDAQCRKLQLQCQTLEGELERQKKSAAAALASQVESRRRLDAARTTNQKLTALQADFDRQAQMLSQAREEVATLERSRNELATRCEQLQAEVDALRKSHQDSREMELELQRLYRQLESNRRQLENEQQQHLGVRKQRDEIQQENRDLRDQLTAARVQIDNQTTNLRNLRSQLEKAKRDMQQAAQSMQSQQSAIAEWERKFTRESAGWKAKVEELTQSRSQLELALAQLRGELEQMEQSSEATIQEITEAARTRMELVIEQRDQAFAELEASRAELEQLKTRCEQNSATIRRLRSERAEVLQRLRLRQTPSFPRMWAETSAATEADERAASRMVDPTIGTLYSEAPQNKDDLKQISGIAQRLEQRLNDLGVYTFDQIASWNQEAAAEVARRLGLISNRIARDEWVAQAKELAEKRTPRRAA